ncbi:hypothetical protein EVAR_2545_1 [Eumeta japonica]|uniref:Uncharacterized protein n=1 Tax=Eumeta variegata TaxID=151549 RepID=A0A4C1SRN5_EUMVA|nr:hypothetical protein EVAR_2545_1 [Eumeta japonica]
MDTRNLRGVTCTLPAFKIGTGPFLEDPLVKWELARASGPDIVTQEAASDSSAAVAIVPSAHQNAPKLVEKVESWLESQQFAAPIEIAMTSAPHPNISKPNENPTRNDSGVTRHPVRFLHSLTVSGST